ncbi:hypothetical protein ATO6_01740 [Oceanicola sp. 22II-s10i]|uniref:AMP-binding protein n=1 Tax=Oceanicola sp. 22II-s10i TaxID=1317116 RepID=UPI000B526499|nr:AMP-binding protein [Oceanicola sp. 22II-s10i]OWU85676.1 hypothetical protein ATO6_01740 [Oceanicola sp. 22II-s10i]
MSDALSFDSLIASGLDMAKAGDPRPLFVTPEGEAISAAAFDDLVGRAAGWLRGQGIGAGDCVAVWLPNRIEWLALMFGAGRIGAMIAAVNTRYRTAELHHILKSSGARMLVFERQDRHTDFLSLVEGLDCTDLPALETFAVMDDGAADPLHERPVVNVALDTAHAVADGAGSADSPALLFTTSGTTNLPKLVLHRQRSLTLHARNSARAYGFDAEGAALLAIMPLCGVFGLNTVLGAMAGGAPVWLNAQWRLEDALSTARAGQVTHFFGSDEMFRQMWRADSGVFDGARLCGFPTFTPGIEGDLREMAEAGVPMCGLYGASEVNAIFSIQPMTLPLTERLKGGGLPAGGDSTQVRVRDSESGALLPDGTPGVIEIKAPTNFAGYYLNPEATARAVDGEGYFRSGDAGYLRGDGTFVYLGRNGDFLRLSGFLTDPREIEEVIEQVEGIEKAQVVGAVDGIRVRPVAFVTTEAGAPGPNEGAVIAHVADRLAHYKVPERVVTLDAFPATESANGLKIQKAKLRQMAEALFRA